jgi:hypothetical protein
MACLRLVTFFPEVPLRRVPAFRSCMTFSTFFWLALLYFRAICKSPMNDCCRLKHLGLAPTPRIGIHLDSLSEDSHRKAAGDGFAELFAMRQAGLVNTFRL